MNTFELRKYRVTEEGKIIFESIEKSFFASLDSVDCLETPESYDDYFFEWECLGNRSEQLHNIINN